MDAIKQVVAEPAILQSKPGRMSGVGIFRFRHGLRFKLLLITIIIAFTSLLLSAFLLLSLQKRQLIASAQASAGALSDAVEASMRHAMLTGDPGMVGDILRAVTADGTIQRVRILDEHGVIAFSSNPGETGMRLDMTTPACQGCHTGEAPAGTHAFVPSTRSTPAVSMSAKPFLNQAQCQGCHGSQAGRLGLLIVETPLPDLNEQFTAGFWRVALSGVAAFGLLIGLLAPALNRYVIRPVEELSRGVAEVSVGNLDYPVLRSDGDELGLLAASFTGMQTRLKTTYMEMERKEQQLAALNAAGLAVTQLLDLQEIMGFALETIVDRLGMDSGLIYLWDENDERYRLCASRGLAPNQIAEIDRRRRSGTDIAGEVAETGREVVVVDMSSDFRFAGIWERLQERSFAELPLVSRGLVVGVLGMVTPPGRRLELGDLEYVRSVGMQIGIALDNALLLDDTRSKEREAVTLYDLGTKISASLALAEVLEAVAQAAWELLDADNGLVGLLDQAGAQVVVQAAAGQGAEAFRGLYIPVWEGSPGHVLVKGQPVMAVEMHKPDDARFFQAADSVREAGIASFLAAPLIHGEHFLGSVVALRQQPRPFVERDARLLLRLAHQVVVSVENAQLYRQLRYLATLEERSRLAREMHDRLAQALGYLNVRASITDDLLSSGRIEPARESLSELKSVAKMVYTDLREAIFGLRTSVSSHSGLVPTLRHFLDEYQAHYGMEAQLTIRSEADFDISLETASQLLCIVQEALANIRKHSGASRAFVQYDQAGGQVCLQIQDDGRGFDPAQVMEVGGQHIGLQVMRERAESIGGSLEIISEPGKGTHVTVRTPIL